MITVARLTVLPFPTTIGSGREALVGENRTVPFARESGPSLQPVGDCGSAAWLCSSGWPCLGAAPVTRWETGRSILRISTPCMSPCSNRPPSRHGVAQWLTEAVAKEIENQTPYKVVSTPDADSVLTGRVVSETQSVLIQNKYNDPREVQVQLLVEVQWVDRRANELMHGRVPIPSELAQVQGTGMLVAEVGQSVATAEQEAITKIASRIVGMMETPW